GQPLLQIAGVLGDGSVVVIASAAEQSRYVTVAQPINELSGEQHRFATGLHHFPADPLEVLLRAVRPRQDVDRALEGDSTDPGQPPADLHSQVVWVWRDLMNEEQPAG